jgi:hypothetical protein
MQNLMTTRGTIRTRRQGELEKSNQMIRMETKHKLQNETTSREEKQVNEITMAARRPFSEAPDIYRSILSVIKDDIYPEQTTLRRRQL